MTKLSKFRRTLLELTENCTQLIYGLLIYAFEVFNCECRREMKGEHKTFSLLKRFIDRSFGRNIHQV
jgi:hypothetical protein